MGGMIRLTQRSIGGDLYGPDLGPVRLRCERGGLRVPEVRHAVFLVAHKPAAGPPTRIKSDRFR